MIINIIYHFCAKFLFLFFYPSSFVMLVFVSIFALYFKRLITMDFKEFVAYVCVERGITQEALSLELGLHRRQLSVYASRNSIGKKIAGKFADYLGCSIFDIPGTRFYRGNKTAENASESLKSVENSFTHKSFLTIKCPCCGKNIVISALCVSEIEDSEE